MSRRARTQADAGQSLTFSAEAGRFSRIGFCATSAQPAVYYVVLWERVEFAPSQDGRAEVDSCRSYRRLTVDTLRPGRRSPGLLPGEPGKTGTKSMAAGCPDSRPAGRHSLPPVGERPLLAFILDRTCPACPSCPLRAGWPATTGPRVQWEAPGRLPQAPSWSCEGTLRG